MPVAHSKKLGCTEQPGLRRADLVEELDDLALGDQGVVDADALAEGEQVRRGKNPGATRGAHAAKISAAVIPLR